MENLNNNDQLFNSQDELVLTELAKNTNEILDQIEKHQPELDKLMNEAKDQYFLANDKQLSIIKKSADNYNEKNLTQIELKKYTDLLNSYIKGDNPMIDKLMKFQSEKGLLVDGKIGPNTKKELENMLSNNKLVDNKLVDNKIIDNKIVENKLVETKLPEYINIAELNNNIQNVQSNNLKQNDKIIDNNLTIEEVLGKENLNGTGLILKEYNGKILLGGNLNNYNIDVNGISKNLDGDLIFSKDLSIFSESNGNILLISGNDRIDLIQKYGYENKYLNTRHNFRANYVNHRRYNQYR